MKYFVIQDGGPAPRALVRTDRHGEQTLTGRGEWTGSGLLAEPEQGWTVTEVEGHVFYDHVYEVIREARAGLPCAALSLTTYRVDEMINISAVMRRRDGVEEWLDRESVWRAEERDLEGRVLLPISEEELERHKWRVVSPKWFAVHGRGGYPYALVRKIPSAEEAFTRDLRWEPSDLLGRPGLRVEELSSGSEAGDVLAAIQIGVRAARRSRRGPRYFALWNTTEFEPRNLHSVIRRTWRREEIHVGPAGWVPSEVVREIGRGEPSFYRPLPITPQEADGLIARQAVVPRCFVVLSREDGRDLPIAVVRVDGEREEAFTRDLVWEPSDLLGRVAGEHGLRVEELRDPTGRSQAYWLAVTLRRRWRAGWEGPHWYYAIFRDEICALDLASAHGLVRTRVDGSDEHSYRDGEWRYTRVLDDISRGKSDDEDMPISPDEAERLMALLDGR